MPRFAAFYQVLVLAVSSAAQSPPAPSVLRPDLIPPTAGGPQPARPTWGQDDTAAAGLPTGSRPEVLTWERVYTLALVRRRAGGGALSEVLDAKALAEQAGR